MSQKKLERPILSICMIVKNEEKNLERCLNSLHSILEGVRSELIITDTGSTDRTIEIANHYTDKVLHFEWCDDFAAARNFGIEKAQGEWLMVIDADEEYIENPSELIEFFNSNLKEQYACAGAIMKNVQDITNRDTKTIEQNMIRFYNMVTKPRYKGRIHEIIPITEPYYQFGFVGYHYGYAFESEEEKLTKQKRNMPLLRKELEENPDEIRMLISTFQAAYDPEEKMEIFVRLVNMTKKEEDPISKIYGYKQIMEHYLSVGNFDKVLETEKNFEKSLSATNRKCELAKIDLWYSLIVALFHLKKYKEGIEYITRYLNLYHNYEEGKIDREILLYIPLNCLSNFKYNDVQLMKFKMLYDLDRKERAVKALGQVREFAMDLAHLKLAMDQVFEVVEEKGIEHLVTRFYQAMKKQEAKGIEPSEIAFRFYTDMMKQIVCYDKEKKFKVANIFLKALSAEQDDFVRVIELIAAEEKSSWKDQLFVYLYNIQNWNFVFPEIYYMALKAEIELPKQAYQVNMTKIQAISSYILKTHKEEILLLIKAILSMTGTQQEEQYKLTFFGDLLEKAIRLLEKGEIGETWTEEEKKAIQKRLLRGYARVMKLLLDVLYRPEILNAESMELLPMFHQLGYWLDGAYTALEKRDYKQCESYIKKFVETDPTMKNAAGWFIGEYEEVRAEQKAPTEFEILAENVKKSIRQFMTQGQLQQAKQLLLQIKNLCPNDIEINEMLEILRKQGI